MKFATKLDLILENIGNYSRDEVIKVLRADFDAKKWFPDNPRAQKVVFEPPADYVTRQKLIRHSAFSKNNPPLRQRCVDAYIGPKKYLQIAQIVSMMSWSP